MYMWTHLADLHELLSPLLASFGGHAQADELLSLKKKKAHTPPPSALVVPFPSKIGPTRAKVPPI
jgi:hypothetical protein